METKPINNYDYQEHRHVGWDASKQNNAMDFLFSEQNIQYLSSKITEMHHIIYKRQNSPQK